MSDSQGKGALNSGVKDQEKDQTKAGGDVQSGPIHHCDSWASFRTATPDASFGHPLHLAPRAMTRESAAALSKCSSFTSIRTVSPELGFGHQLRRVAKHQEATKTETSPGAKSKDKADKTPNEEGAKGEEKKDVEK